MFQRRIAISAPLLSGIVCLLLLALYNLSYWQQILKVATLPFAYATGVLILSLFYAFLTLFSSRFTYKPFLFFVFLVSAICAYTMDTYGYVISTEAFRNVVETDSQEVINLMHWRLLRDMVLFFAIPSLVILFLDIEYPRFRIRLLHICICLALCAINVVMYSSHYATALRNHKRVKFYINPIRPIYSMTKYMILRFKPGQSKELLEIDPNPTRIVTAGKPKLVVLIVGESDRAMNHQLNGYAKNTDPLLAARDDIISFKKFYSCGTETTVSVPCMFSVYKRDEYTDHKGTYTENVLDLLRKTNVEVLWRDNDGGCKNVCNRVTTHDLNQANLQPYCNGAECQDDVLLHNLDEYINNSVKDKLIVLHKKGSHGPKYYKRYPLEFARFTPTCNTNELHKCSDKELVNTYDNITLYNDFFLHSVIEKLERSSDKYQTAMIYLSDHGESLGEHGVYLHGMPYWLAPKEQTHVPFIFWASKDFTVDRNHLNRIQEHEFSHDHLFHSLLGLFNVKTAVYVKDLDIFAAS